MRVEAHVRPGLPGTTIVGLPDLAVKESRERVRSAAASSGLPLPSQRITLSLSPGDVRKEGPGFDLPLALAALAAAGHVEAARLANMAAVGEVGLDGVVRGVRGTLAIAERAREKGALGLVLPVSMAPEAAQVEGLRVYGVRSLLEAVRVVGKCEWADHVERRTHRFVRWAGRRRPQDDPVGADMSEIAGCRQAKWGLEVAAVGGHHVLMVGSPGSGKTMLARRFPTILPKLSSVEALEVTRIWSVCGVRGPSEGLMHERPFRSPHHTASASALVGGGGFARPGEITLAHRGVLFLDEFPEFTRDVLEALRQPLEEGCIVISRGSGTHVFPARFTLIAAMNPCPCGSFGHPQRPCTCTAAAVAAYQGKLSGPLLDRIDLVVDVPPIQPHMIADDVREESSSDIAERVERGLAFQRWRREFSRAAGELGSGEEAVGEDAATRAAPSSFLATAARYRLTREARSLLSQFLAKQSPGGRGLSRAMALARTVADLAESLEVTDSHLAQALILRNRDRTRMGSW